MHVVKSNAIYKNFISDKKNITQRYNDVVKYILQNK